MKRILTEQGQVLDGRRLCKNERNLTQPNAIQKKPQLAEL